ncbi:hypothetical protein F4827_002141 [Paraburkholderia bannensis]|uniref:Uncharacterized protein n=1 Tax=Paraburkholderia bannensis TaxID=765414 RepID=A0A7W9TVT2_9BURK|nr:MULTISPECIES: DUF6402 family protein [Paraburkholderia]MBB3257312.1 hypothetical protein [Paraburkholderia sp. WP4_3_2]MBB6102292.1 hypothetical protein [Paraburkholderia bannensis]
MSAQELFVYTPSAGEWRKQAGNVVTVSGEAESNPGVARDARYLVTPDKFEITDIPAAMSKMGWHVSAALLRKWFAYAPKNQALDGYQKSFGISSDGRTGKYPDDRFDTQTIKLDWVLSFPRSHTGLRKLQDSKYLYSGNLASIYSAISPYSGRRVIDTLDLTGGNIQELHNKFQFQLARIDTSAMQKAEQFFGAALHHGKPDDLAGALGGFALYAAVAEVRFQQRLLGGVDAEITKVAIYVKNPYSYFDNPKEGGSQYLGHWNKDGICLVPEGYIAQQANWGGWSQYAIKPEGPYGRTFWPVHNRDFRRWQDAHNAGGDMILFSDYRIININPISFRVRR